MVNLVSLKNNNLNIVNQIYDFNLPNYIYIPIGDLKLKKDEYIYKNTDLNGYLTSVSGYISDIKRVNLNNKLTDCYEIKNDYKENQKNKYRKKAIKNKDELISKLDEYHLSSIKDLLVNIKDINNLVITSIDDEEYGIKEAITLANYYDEILNTIDDLMDILNIDSSILALKNTNYNSIKNVKSIIGIFPSIKIKLLPDKFLIGKKEFLCDYLSIDKNTTLLLKTSDILSIYNVLNAKDNFNNIITISGSALKKSLVINTKLYVSLQDIIKELLELNTSDYDLFINGYLKGKKANNENIIITRDIEMIVINKKDDTLVTECINCGACKKICPFNISVKKCYEKNLNNKLCIGCGLCNYICPAKRKLKEIVWGDYNE